MSLGNESQFGIVQIKMWQLKKSGTDCSGCCHEKKLFASAVDAAVGKGVLFDHQLLRGGWHFAVQEQPHNTVRA